MQPVSTFSFTGCQYDPSNADQCAAHPIAKVADSLCVLSRLNGDLIGYDSVMDRVTITSADNKKTVIIIPVTVAIATGASVYQDGESWYLKVEGPDFSITVTDNVSGKTITFAQKAFQATASCAPWSNLGLSDPPTIATVQNALHDAVSVPSGSTCVLSTVKGYGLGSPQFGGGGPRAASVDANGLTTSNVRDSSGTVQGGLWATATCFAGTSGSSNVCGIASVNGSSTTSRCL